MSSICKQSESVQNDYALAACAATVPVERALSPGVDSCTHGYQVTGEDSAVKSRDGSVVNALFEQSSSYLDWPSSFAIVLPYVEEPVRRSVSWLAGGDSVSAQCEETDMVMLDQIYQMRPVERVHELIESEPALVPILEQAPDHIGLYFQDPQLSLEVFCDPEEESPRQLVIWIGTHLSPAEALAQRKALMRAWGFSAMQEAHNRLSFSVEPV